MTAARAGIAAMGLLARKGEARPATLPRDDAATGRAEERTAAPPRADRHPAGGPRVALTLRLDAARHHGLKLACAATRRSAQSILVEALDAYLETVPALPGRAHRRLLGTMP